LLHQNGGWIIYTERRVGEVNQINILTSVWFHTEVAQ